MEAKHTQSHTAEGGVTESSVSTMEAEHTQSHTAGASTTAATTGMRPMRKPPIIGAGKLQDMNNVEYDATIFDAISDEKDAVHWEYDVTFFNPDADAIINTTVTWNNSRVDKWIEDVCSDHTFNCRLIVGITGLCIPPHDGPICLLCLCAGRRCLIYQIDVAKRRIGEMPVSLASFLENQKNQFVGVNVEKIIARLQRDYHIGSNVPYKNLREEVEIRYRQRDLARASLKQLAAIVLKTDCTWQQGEKVSENWDALLLNQLQVLVGTFAAYLCNEVGWHVYHSKCCLILPN